MRSLLLAASLLAGSFGATARAGYDQTEWGMALAQVQKLYPGGFVDRQPTRTEYRVIRAVGEMPTAMIAFDFSGPKGGLSKVSILFPEQGTDVDLRQALFEPPSPTQAETVRMSLRAALTAKYGKPVASKEKDDAWVTPAGDGIYLGVVPVGAGLAPVVVYSPPKPDGADRTRGL